MTLKSPRPRRIAERERIDRELLELFGDNALPRRGRPRKDRPHEAQAQGQTAEPVGGE